MLGPTRLTGVQRYTVPNDFITKNWLGLSWSDWLGLDASPKAFRETITPAPGLYRVRVKGTDTLAYIGQTGRNLRERARSLGRNTHQSRPPWNDPHTAAPGLWAWRVEEGYEYELSVAQSVTDRARRQCIEDLLLYEYRLEAGESTLCNHGRFHPGWSRPTNRKRAREMIRLVGRTNPAGGSSLAPARFSDNPSAEYWLFLNWSERLPLSTHAHTPSVAGVYKLMRDDEVIYVGQSEGLRDRLRSHSARFCQEDLCASWIEMPHALPHHLLERETDLIGAFYKALLRPPSLQYERRTPGTRKQE